MHNHRFASRVLALVALGGAGAWGLSLWAGAQRSAFAQGAAPSGNARIATVDVLEVVERMVFSDKYRPSREARAAEINKGLQDIINQMQTLEAQAKDLKPDTPEFQPLAQQYAGLQQELEAKRAEGGRELESVNFNQLQESYRTVYDAARAMAKREGYSQLLASRRGEVKFRSNNVNGLLQEILARPVLDVPAEDDLTQRLIDELKLADVQVVESVTIGPDGRVVEKKPTEVPAGPASAEAPK
jgi:Skp family chaperone for outer membrane proteins